MTRKSGKGMQTSDIPKDYKHKVPKSVIRSLALKAIMLLTLRLLRSFCKGTTLEILRFFFYDCSYLKQVNYVFTCTSNK